MNGLIENFALETLETRLSCVRAVIIWDKWPSCLQCWSFPPESWDTFSLKWLFVWTWKAYSGEPAHRLFIYVHNLFATKLMHWQEVSGLVRPLGVHIHCFCLAGWIYFGRGSLLFKHSFELNVELAKVCTSQLVLRQHVNGKDASKHIIIQHWNLDSL